MASPEFPQPEQIPPPVDLKKLKPDEWLAHMGQISKGLEEDHGKRVQSVKESVVKEEISRYREKFPDASREMTDDDIRKIIVESKERQGGSYEN